MLQMSESVGYLVKGSITAVSASGTTSMSLVWMDCQPRMLDPSKPRPSSKIPSVSSSTGTEKCCHSPGKSMNLKSTIIALFSFASFYYVFGCHCVPPLINLNSDQIQVMISFN